MLRSAGESAVSVNRLLLVFFGWALAYLAIVWVLWLVGIEAIYRHPTPFYALFAPVLGQGWSSWLVSLLPIGPILAWRLTRRFGRLTRLAAAAVTLVAVAAGIGFSVSNPAGAAMGSIPVWQTILIHVAALGLIGGAIAACAAGLRTAGFLPGAFKPRAVIWYLVALVAFSFLFSASVAMMRGGLDGIMRTYERTRYEYIKDIGAGGSTQGLFGEYTEFMELGDYLSMHSKVHPPGPVAILWFMSFAVGREPLALSLATMAFGSLAVIPLFLWVREMFDKRVAVTAGLLYVVVPGIVLFTATSADILFMPFTLTTLYLFWRAIVRSERWAAFGAGAGYGIMSVLSFSLIGLGVFFAFAGLYFLRRREYHRRVIGTAAFMLLAAGLFQGALWWWSGYDFVNNFVLAKAQFDLDQRLLDEFDPRYPSWTFKFWNPMCWFFFAGVPVSVLFVWRFLRHGEAPAGLLAIFPLTVLALVFLYLGRGEGERSAMYVYPFILAPAAHLLTQFTLQSDSLRPLLVTMACVALQTWCMESLLFTYW